MQRNDFFSTYKHFLTFQQQHRENKPLKKSALKVWKKLSTTVVSACFRYAKSTVANRFGLFFGQDGRRRQAAIGLINYSTGTSANPPI